MALNKGDLFRYRDFHLAQSVPAGALFASSRTSISLCRKISFIPTDKVGIVGAYGPNMGDQR